MGKHAISIWFFIGIILLVYGVLIFGAGIYGLFHAPAQPVVKAELHAGIWWGILLLALGSLYCWKFNPRRHKPHDGE